MLEPVRYTLTSDFTEPGLRTLDSLRRLVDGVGGVIDLEVVLDGGQIPVVALSFVAHEKSAKPLGAMPGVVLEIETKLKKSSLDTMASWALPAIATGTVDASLGYEAPVTPGNTRLYLIDTSVSQQSGWLEANPNVTMVLEKTIRGANDPPEPIAFDHGTAMLSLVVQPDLGVAPRTPLEVVNYDVFPEPETTSVALVASALTEAASHHWESAWMPGVILLALSTEGAETSYLLERTVSSVIERGLTVVVSAGNHGGSASDVIPAAYGEMQGVVCVGAHDQAGAICSFSNTGPALDLLGPGVAVPVVVPQAGGGVQVAERSGTSQAAALAAGVAIIHLSRHPEATPTAVEAAMLEAASPSDVPRLRLIQPKSDDSTLLVETREERFARVGAGESSVPAAIDVSLGADDSHFLDPAAPADGNADPVETFHGPGGRAGGLYEIRLDPATGNITFTFPVATDLFEAATPFDLLDGSHWRVRCSPDGKVWSTPVGTLSTHLDEQDRLFVTATLDAHGPRCLIRLEIVP